MAKVFPYTTDVNAIPTTKLVNPESGRVCYACPDKCWVEHLDAWRKAIRRAEKDERDALPEPMPYGHCMFDDPCAYARVPFGCTDLAVIRAAIESRVRGDLVGGGWCRDLSDEQIESIIKATVDAKVSGANAGAMPFVACLLLSL